MESIRNACGMKLVEPNSIYYGLDGHVRLAHEIGYALNDFCETDRQEILKGSYSCIYVRACFLKPILDAKEWIECMKSQIKKRRRIDAVTIVKRLKIKQPEFVDNLYRAFELKNENDYLDSFYKNEYIRKWISIEDRFRSKGIDVNPKDYPRGIAINLQLIEEYLDEEYGLPFN